MQIGSFKPETKETNGKCVLTRCVEAVKKVCVCFFVALYLRDYFTGSPLSHQHASAMMIGVVLMRHYIARRGRMGARRGHHDDDNADDDGTQRT